MASISTECSTRAALVNRTRDRLRNRVMLPFTIYQSSSGSYEAFIGLSPMSSTVTESGRGGHRTSASVAVVVLILLFPLGVPPATGSSQDLPLPRDTLWGTTTFWRWSIFDRDVRYQTQALLTKISEQAYWYVESVLVANWENYTGAQMDAIGAVFDAQVMPRLHAAFGYEPLPPNDVDSEPRITILIYDDVGVSYFDPRNELPATVEPTSNEREMVYVQFEPEPERLLSVIAHELTHLIQWNYRGPAVDWVDEGLASVGSQIAGFPNDLVSDRFLNDTTAGLALERGAGQLFVTYLMEHYGGSNLTRSLTQNRESGFPRIRSTLLQLGQDRTVGEVFRDWTIANIVNTGTTDARYRYESLTRHANLTFSASGLPWSGTIQDLGNGGAAYIGIGNPSGAGLRVERTVSSPGFSVFLIVQSLADVRVVEGRPTADGSSLDFEATARGATLILVASYLDERASLNASLSVTIRLTWMTPPEVCIFVAGTTILAPSLLIFALHRRRRKKGGGSARDGPGAD